jgi:hypothetical protein
VPCANISSDLILESLDFRPQDDLSRSQDARDGGFDLWADFAVLNFEITKRDSRSLRTRHAQNPFHEWLAEAGPMLIGMCGGKSTPDAGEVSRQLHVARDSA